MTYSFPLALPSFIFAIHHRRHLHQHNVLLLIVSSQYEPVLSIICKFNTSSQHRNKTDFLASVCHASIVTINTVQMSSWPLKDAMEEFPQHDSSKSDTDEFEPIIVTPASTKRSWSFGATPTGEEKTGGSAASSEEKLPSDLNFDRTTVCEAQIALLANVLETMAQLRQLNESQNEVNGVAQEFQDKLDSDFEKVGDFCQKLVAYLKCRQQHPEWREYSGPDGCPLWVTFYKNLPGRLFGGLFGGTDTSAATSTMTSSAEDLKFVGQFPAKGSGPREIQAWIKLYFSERNMLITPEWIGQITWSENAVGSLSQSQLNRHLRIWGCPDPEDELLADEIIFARNVSGYSSCETSH